MSRPHVSRKCFLTVHDAIKKIDADAEVKAFVTNRGKFQSDMVCLMRAYKCNPTFTAEYGSKLQAALPFCNLTAKRFRIDIEFMGSQENMSLQLGMPGITIEDVNEEPEYDYRTPLRSSLGYDEERFMRSAPRMATLAAVKLEEWTHKNLSTDFQPHTYFWLANAYRMLEAFPTIPNEYQLYAAVKEKFYVYFGEEPFDCPYCPGEDMHTMRTVRNLCRSLLPNWDGKPELREPICA